MPLSPHHPAPLLARAGDWGLVAACAGFAVLDLLILLASGRSSTWLGIGLGSVGVVAVLGLSLASVAAVALRRSRCMTALVGLSLLSLATSAVSVVLGTSWPPSFAVLFALAVLVARALHVEPELPAAGATALALVAVLGEPARVQDNGFVQFAQVLCVIGLGGAVVVGLWLRFNDWRRTSVEEAVRSDERLEIARELHDLVGHYVTGIVVQAQAGQLVVGRDPDAAATCFGRIEAAGADAMSAVRRMVGDLRDEPVRNPGSGWREVELLIDDASSSGVPVRCSLDPRAREVPLELTSSVHRLVAESLTNVRRHALGVTTVDVSIRVEGSELVVDVHDDGAPVQSGTVGPRTPTFGLVGMRERAESLGGTLFAGPAPGGGWLVSARLPISAIGSGRVPSAPAPAPASTSASPAGGRHP